MYDDGVNLIRYRHYYVYVKGLVRNPSLLRTGIAHEKGEKTMSTLIAPIPASRIHTSVPRAHKNLDVWSGESDACGFSGSLWQSIAYRPGHVAEKAHAVSWFYGFELIGAGRRVHPSCVQRKEVNISVGQVTIMIVLLCVMHPLWRT